MKNLKRALSFALASVMVIGMMVVGAGAADFTDADKIVNDEAVNTMVALNVLNGKGDGTAFDPEGTLTRAEAAKIIVYVLHGGKAPVIGTKATPTYSDIKGNWAESYIEYCSSVGIIAGWDGKFNPTGELTGSQFAKMLLVAMNYDAKVFGLTGTDWEINTNVEANKAGIYEDLDINPSAVVSRDDAAQMAYNAIMAGTMSKTWTQNADGEISQTYRLDSTATLYSTKFGGDKVEGYLVSASYTPATKKYNYTIDPDGVIPVVNANDVTISTEKDFTALLGQKVTALYKDVTGAVESGYGIYADCDTVTATVGELDLTPVGATKIKLASTAYTLNANDSSTNVYVFTSNNMAAATGTTLDNTAANYDQASALTLVDTDKDGKYNYAIVAPVTVAKVTYVGANGITASGAYTFEDDKIEEGLAKGDFVTIVNPVNTVYTGYEIAKIDTVTGTIDGVKNTTDVLVNGKWYSCAQNGGDAITLNKEFTFAVIGGYYYNADKISIDASMNDLVLVTAHDTYASMGIVKVKIMATDGTTKVVDVNKVDSDDDIVTGDVSGSQLLDNLYTYKVKDGCYQLTTVGSTNALGYTYAGSEGQIVAKTPNVNAHTTTNGVYFADDAVIFVKNVNTTTSKTTYKAVTGAKVNDWDANYGASSEVLYKTVNGVKYAVAGFVSATGAGSAIPGAQGESGNYGYVVSTPYSVKEGDDTYFVYDIWTGTAKVTVKDEDATLNVARKDIISYNDLGNGHVDTTTKVAGGATAAVAVTGFNDKTFEAVAVNGSAITDTAITKDTVVMYVDSKNVAGVAGGEMALAAVQGDGSRIMNAWTVGDSAGKVELIVIEVNNDIEDLANTFGTGAAGIIVGAVSLTGSASNLSGVTLTVSKDLTYAITGDTVTVTVKVATAGTTTGAVNLTDGVSTTYATIPAGTYALNQVAASFTIPASASPTTFTKANG